MVTSLSVLVGEITHGRVEVQGVTGCKMARSQASRPVGMGLEPQVWQPFPCWNGLCASGGEAAGVNTLPRPPSGSGTQSPNAERYLGLSALYPELQGPHGAGLAPTPHPLPVTPSILNS